MGLFDIARDLLKMFLDQSGDDHHTSHQGPPPAARGSAPPPPARMIEIQYENFRGENKVFEGNANTLRTRGNHLSLEVAPTGRRIALNRDRIGNLSEVEGHLS